MKAEKIRKMPVPVSIAEAVQWRDQAVREAHQLEAIAKAASAERRVWLERARLCIKRIEDLSQEKESA